MAKRALVILVGILAAMAVSTMAVAYEVTEKDIATLQADMATGKITAVELVKAYDWEILGRKLTQTYQRWLNGAA